MTRSFRFSLGTLACVAGTLTLTSLACAGEYWSDSVQYARVSVGTAPPAPVAAGRVVYAHVQSTPQYDLRRPEVMAGSTITLFKSFLGEKKGVVLLNLEGAALKCRVIAWRPESVTVALPMLGLDGPKDVDVVVIMPDGRVAKTFHLVLLPQPYCLGHADTVPQPAPSAPGAQAGDSAN